MATLLLDVTIEGLTNEEVEIVATRIGELIKTKYPSAEMDINGDTEYDSDEDDE